MEVTDEPELKDHSSNRGGKSRESSESDISGNVDPVIASAGENLTGGGSGGGRRV